MLRFRSKRPEWEFIVTDVDLPLSTSSSSSLSDKSDIRLTRQDGTGLFYSIQRFKKSLLILLAFVLSLLILYYVSLFRTPAGHSSVQSPSNSHLNTTTNVIRQKSKRPQRGKPPLVERSILDKLALLDQSADDPDELRHHIITPAWPPAVTHIPEARFQFQHEPISKVSLAEFDSAICGAEICRFILPLRIVEQESKARLHFLQILELAERLDRIVVLPNVGKSRMGTCFKWNFEKYYDIKQLSGGGRMRVIDMETFRRWTATRPVKASSQIVSIDPKPLASASSDPSFFSVHGLIVKIHHDQDPSDLKHARCLKKKFPRLDLRAYSPISVHPSKWAKQSAFEPAVVDALGREHTQSDSFRTADDMILDPVDPQQQDYDKDVDVVATSSTDPDVLILNYDLRHTIFPISTTLSYNPMLAEFVTHLLSSLEPEDCLVVHWRMETVPLNVLSDCASALVSTLTSLLKENEAINTVWFASDYPYPISRAGLGLHRPSNQKDKSGTFKEVGSEHDVAVDIFRNAFDEGGPLAGRRVTGLAEELARVQAAAKNSQMEIDIENELLEDAGVLGIFDKIVAMQVGLFVTGAKGCGRVRYVYMFCAFV